MSNKWLAIIQQLSNRPNSESKMLLLSWKSFGDNNVQILKNTSSHLTKMRNQLSKTAYAQYFSLHTADTLSTESRFATHDKNLHASHNNVCYTLTSIIINFKMSSCWLVWQKHPLLAMMPWSGNTVMFDTWIHKFFQKSRSHLKILWARRVTGRKFYTKGPKILGATVQNLVTWLT